MIVAKLQGGLWNQMFQYAFAKSLSVKFSKALKFETSFFNYFLGKESYLSKRKFELDIFTGSRDINSANYTNRYLYTYSNKYLDFIVLKCKNIFNNFFSWYFRELVRWYNTNFVKKIEKALLKNSIILDGNWQSEKFFMWYEDKIRNDFQFDVVLSAYACEMKNLIQSKNSISIHIRRGDYINSVNSSLFAQCNLNYYYNSIQYMQKNIDDPTFFIFCEDEEWAIKNFTLDCDVIIVTPNQEYPYEDMYLMSRCNHNIIANSTFSWRGAWLNNNTNKIIIHPSLLFTAHSWVDDSNFYPPSWISLPINSDAK